MLSLLYNFNSHSVIFARVTSYSLQSEVGPNHITLIVDIGVFMSVIQTDPAAHIARQRPNRIDLFQVVYLGAAQQGEASNPKERVINIAKIAGSIRDTAVLLVLRVQNELNEMFFVDPRDLLADFHGTQAPPRVAHVGQLHGPPIESAIVECSVRVHIIEIAELHYLALAQPPVEHVDVDHVVGIEDGQRGDTAKDHAAMTLGAWFGAIASVEVAAAQQILLAALAINRMQTIQQ
mmetsp:Transcript_56727/g.90354  ORF Transcript_56727/g.90354 Transcript_56727/m.90354 type:complete len:235 (-) Transcript_56727:195-899(-)